MEVSVQGQVDPSAPKAMARQNVITGIHSTESYLMAAGEQNQRKRKANVLLKAYPHRTKLYILKHPTPPNTICDD